MTGERPEGSEGMEGAAGPDWGGGTLRSQGFPTALPSQSWETPRVPLPHSPPSPPWPGPGSARAQISLVSARKQRHRQLHSPSSVIQLAVLEQAGTELCAKILLLSFPLEVRSQTDLHASVTLVDTPRHKPLSSPEQMSRPWWAHLLEGSG